MNNLIKRRSPRELILFTVTCLVAIAVPTVQRLIIPAYDQWRTLRSSVQLRAIEYTRLTSNLAVKDRINEQFAALDTDIVQDQSDQITLSEYLRSIEKLARYPSMTLINMKPLPVVSEETFKTYRVRLSVAGTLPDVLRFVSSLMTDGTATGLDGFSIRGVQGDNRVECSMSLSMIRLMPLAGSAERIAGRPDKEEESSEF